jgi:hypothetical protein
MFEHITSLKRFQQQICYGNLRFERGIMPTDIDLYVEFEGKEFVVGEFKKRGASMPYGQELALTRLLKQLACDTQKHILAFVAEHSAPSDQHIDAASCYVAKVWRNQDPKWSSPSIPITVKDLIHRWRYSCQYAEPVPIDNVEFSKDLKGVHIASALLENLSEDQLSEILFCLLERHRQKLSISEDLAQLPLFRQFVA